MGVQWNKQKNGFCFSCAWLKEIQRKSTSNFRGHSAWRNILMTDLFIDMCKTVFYYIFFIFTIFSMSSSILNVFTLMKKKNKNFLLFATKKINKLTWMIVVEILTFHALYCGDRWRKNLCSFSNWWQKWSLIAIERCCHLQIRKLFGEWWFCCEDDVVEDEKDEEE